MNAISKFENRTSRNFSSLHLFPTVKWNSQHRNNYAVCWVKQRQVKVYKVQHMIDYMIRLLNSLVWKKNECNNPTSGQVFFSLMKAKITYTWWQECGGRWPWKPWCNQLRRIVEFLLQKAARSSKSNIGHDPTTMLTSCELLHIHTPDHMCFLP